MTTIVKIWFIEDAEQHKRTQIMIVISLPNFRMFALVYFNTVSWTDARWIQYPMNKHALISANGALFESFLI